MKNNIGVVIPSYNEIDNLLILVRRLKDVLPKAQIVIVDDSSEDENKKLKEILKSEKKITIISRFKKQGRGTAVLKGFKEILKRKEIEHVFEMDSDLAHDPREMKRFLTKLKEKDFDLIIGSRYLPGGKIRNISADRTIMSRLINKWLYYWLGIHITDHTSGFRLYSRTAINFLTKTKIKSKGFITLSETAYKLKRGGFSLAEVPITWNYRIYGKSNVNLSELLNSLYFVIKMRVLG